MRYYLHQVHRRCVMRNVRDGKETQNNKTKKRNITNVEEKNVSKKWNVSLCNYGYPEILMKCSSSVGNLHRQIIYLLYLLSG